MLSSSDLLLGGVLPGLVALAARQATLRSGAGDRFAWPAALVVGYTTGAAGLAGGVSTLLAPREASHWLPLAAALALCVAILAQLKGNLRYAALAVGAVLAIALPLRMLWGSVYLLSEWSRAEAIVRIGGIALGYLFIGWAATARLTESQSEQPAEEPEGAPHSCCLNGSPSRLSDALIAPLLILVAFGVAVVLATSGSLSYAQLAGVVVASLAGTTLGGLGCVKLRDLSIGVVAAGPIVVVLIGSLILLGTLYAEVTTLHAGLLLAAMIAAAAKCGCCAPACGWRSAVLRTMACLTPLAVAVALSAAAFSEAVNATPANPYENWRPAEETTPMAP